MKSVLAGDDAGAVERARQARTTLTDILDLLREVEQHLRSSLNCSAIEVARGVLERRRPDLARSGASARVVADDRVTCLTGVPAVVLDRILDNCVANSLRALAGCSRRDIDIAIREDNGSCVVEVRDTGCGLELPPAEWDRVFDRGYGTRSPEAGRNAPGFGLYRARSCLKQYGGSIAVAVSAAGEGTTFRIVLPAGADGIAPRGWRPEAPCQEKRGPHEREAVRQRDVPRPGRRRPAGLSR